MDTQQTQRMLAKLPYVTSAQNPLNQVEQLHPECYSGRHIWLGQYQHSSFVLISIIRAHSQIHLWCSASHYLLHFRRWTSPDPSCSSGRPRTTWPDHIYSDTSMSLIDTFSLAQDHLHWRAKAMRIWLSFESDTLGKGHDIVTYSDGVQGAKISPVGDWRSTSLEWRFSILDRFIESDIPSSITHQPLPT